jgi:hypothetical protein
MPARRILTARSSGSALAKQQRRKKMRCWATCTLIALSACGGSASTEVPVSLASRYTLTSYDGAALPVTLRVIVSVSLPGGPPDSRCEDQLTDQRLEFGPNASVLQVSGRRLICDQASSNAVFTDSLAGLVTVGADEVTMMFAGAGGTGATARARTSPGELEIYRVESTTPLQGYDATVRHFRAAP